MNDNNKTILANIRNNTSANKEGAIMTNIKNVIDTINDSVLFTTCLRRNCGDLGGYAPISKSWFGGEVRAEVVSDSSHYAGGNVAVVFVDHAGYIRFIANASEVVDGLFGFEADYNKVDAAVEAMDSIEAACESVTNLCEAWNTMCKNELDAEDDVLNAFIEEDRADEYTPMYVPFEVRLELYRFKVWSCAVRYIDNNRECSLYRSNKLIMHCIIAAESFDGRDVFDVVADALVQEVA